MPKKKKNAARENQTIKLPKNYWRPTTIDVGFVLVSLGLLIAAFCFAEPGTAAFEAFRNAIPVLAIVVALYPNFRRDAKDAEERHLERANKIRDRIEHMVQLQVSMTVELNNATSTVSRWLKKTDAQLETLVTALPSRPVCNACVAKIDELPLGIMTAIAGHEGAVQVYEATLRKHPAEKPIAAASLKVILAELLTELKNYSKAMDCADIDEQPRIVFER